MRSTNRKRALLVSSAVILLCMTIVVGMTWALFTDVQPVYNHLQAGDLDITLERTGLTKKMLDEDGFFETVVYNVADGRNPYYDFTNTTYGDVNIFDIGADEKIVPQTKYTADMKISNKSDVAFEYWFEVVNTAGPGTASTGNDIKEQLQITVTIWKTVTDDEGNETKVAKHTFTKKLSEGVYVVKDNTCVLGIGESEEFTVSVEFLNDSDNNEAKNQNAYFDLVVHANQYVAANPDTVVTP